ncbi:MAG TPA: c-type cytochrome [Usitatibacteraceae bacterium]|nr:c-type cytochrome [Usitatibacteraceae bacterium]
MRMNSRLQSRFNGGARRKLAWLAGGILIAAALPAGALDIDRSGKVIVQATCAACHATGKDGAPRIGDRAAWVKLQQRGLASLTQSALDGIRKMPAHGGSADASDLEISRAIVYMVNQSGGKWIEPIGKPVPSQVTDKITIRPQQLSGKQIVDKQCGKCHQTGDNGAPKIGDRDAWTQRLKRGMDEVVRSAFNGHGPMPARGGLAEVTVNEMRNAIIYMFNPASATFVPKIAPPSQPNDPFHRAIAGAELYFGITPAETLRTAQQKQPVAAFDKIPDGKNFYHLNVTLRDRVTKNTITNAQVEARVEDPALRGETKPLDVLAINQGISYGAFVELATPGKYLITIKVKRDGGVSGETRFEYTRK